MSIVKEELMIDAEENGGGEAPNKDPVQQFVQDMSDEREKKIRDLRVATDMLYNMSSEHRNYIAEMMEFLKELGKITGVVNDNTNGNSLEGFAEVRRYIKTIKFNVTKLMKNCEDIASELADCKKMALGYEKELIERRKKEKHMKFVEDSYHRALEDNKAKERLSYQHKIRDLNNFHEKELESLRKEITEKDKQLKEMQDEANKTAKIRKLKRQNEEIVMSIKELEDLEDMVSKKIKILHMRKLFVKSVHEKVKSAIPEDDKQRQVIEKSLNTSMETVETLKVEMSRIMQIVQQKDTHH